MNPSPDFSYRPTGIGRWSERQTGLIGGPVRCHLAPPVASFTGQAGKAGCDSGRRSLFLKWMMAASKIYWPPSNQNRHWWMREKNASAHHPRNFHFIHRAPFFQVCQPKAANSKIFPTSSSAHGRGGGAGALIDPTFLPFPTTIDPSTTTISTSTTESLAGGTAADLAFVSPRN